MPSSRTVLVLISLSLVSRSPGQAGISSPNIRPGASLSRLNARCMWCAETPIQPVATFNPKPRLRPEVSSEMTGPITLFTRLLHNYAVFALQRRFYQQGLPLLILPIRV